MKTDSDTDASQKADEKNTPSPEAGAESSAPETALSPEEQLAAEVAKYKDLALRAHADLDNYRKRMAREKEDSIRYANFNLIESLLPILDNFELGLAAARNAPESSGIVMGFEMVRKQLEDFLRDQGVQVIDALGGEFDPNLHDAVAQEPSDEAPEGSVIRQIRRGFKLKDRLIRPASVVVSKGPAAE